MQMSLKWRIEPRVRGNRIGLISCGSVVKMTSYIIGFIRSSKGNSIIRIYKGFMKYIAYSYSNVSEILRPDLDMQTTALQ